MVVSAAVAELPVRRLPPASGIRQVFDRAQQLERDGHEILHLEVGRPDWQLPPGAVDAAKAALDDGFVHYSANRGLLELREALADDIRETSGCQFDAESEMIVTVGASEAVAVAMLSLLGSGDEVIIPEPAWPHYKALAELAGAHPVSLPLSAGDGFLLDPDRLREALTPRTRMIVVNTPGNPTGAVQGPEVLADVARLALREGLYVLADEVYQHFVYDGQHASIGASLGGSELFLYVNSFSKSYVMTGWRIGCLAAERRLSDAFNRIHQHLTVCAPVFAQKAAAEMLRHPQRLAYLQEMQQEFQGRQAVWTAALADCPGVQLVAPRGAFYLFPRLPLRGESGSEFCRRLLDEHHVAAVPGEIFGAAFDQHIRISYGRSLATQRPAAQRIREVLRGQCP